MPREVLEEGAVGEAVVRGVEVLKTLVGTLMGMVDHRVEVLDEKLDEVGSGSYQEEDKTVE